MCMAVMWGREREVWGRELLPPRSSSSVLPDVRPFVKYEYIVCPTILKLIGDSVR